MAGLEQILQGLQGGGQAPQGNMQQPLQMPPQGQGIIPPEQAPMPSLEQVAMIIQMLRTMGLINEQMMAQVTGGMNGQPNPMTGQAPMGNMGGIGNGIPTGL